jgi:hypothetical protein
VSMNSSSKKGGVSMRMTVYRVVAFCLQPLAGDSDDSNA